MDDEFGKATEVYNLIIELDCKDSYSYNCRGVCYFCMKEYNKAVDDYTAAIKINPNESLIWANRANAYLHTK